jgi:flavin-binding protein dodecin
MPRDPATGVFTRVSNSFSNPIVGEIIDPVAATALDDDYDEALTNSIPQEPVAVTGSSATVAAGTAAVAIQRAAPSTTALALPPVLSQNGVPLHIVDWSTSVTDHTITLTPDGSEKIMQAATWPIYSNTTQLGSLTLYPSTVLGGWYL